MNEHGRRDVMKLAGGGLAALGVSGAAASAPTAALAASKVNAARKVSVKGAMPITPELAAVMPPSPALMSALCSEFAPLAAKMGTQKAYWLAANAWITNRLTGPIMDGKVGPADIGPQAWAVHASGYWGGVEFRTEWGARPSRPGAKRPVPAETQAKMAAMLKTRLDALNAGGEACLALLPELMHDNSTTGTIFTISYNSACQVVKTENPPLGERRPTRPWLPAAVRLYSRYFLRIDYDLPGLVTPRYLQEWRSYYEQAATAHPDLHEKVLVGGPGQTDLRDIWKNGVDRGHTNWGGDATDVYDDAYYKETVYWALYMGLGLEAVALASMVAAINRDPEAARRAVLGNALFIGETYGWGIGMGDAEGKLPIVA